MDSCDAVEYIEHEAVVMSVNNADNTVRVRINDGDECGSCPASALCRANGSPTNDITVAVSHPSEYKVDDIVTIRGTEQLHRKAIRLAVILPSVAMVALMVLVYVLTASQLAAALAGIATLIIFYILLYMARNRIAHEFSFEIVGKPERLRKPAT